MVVVIVAAFGVNTGVIITAEIIKIVIVVLLLQV